MKNIDLQLIPEPVHRLREILGPEKSYAVGGIVRDTVLMALYNGSGKITRTHGNDWDIATPLLPKEVISRLRQANITAVPIGFEHGTVAAVIDQVQYEITTFRYDIDYKDGRHPTIQFTDSIEEDLKRRDFTVNAFALDIDTGEILDLFSGIEDLKKRVIRSVGNPEHRFEEDHLRMLRAARFAAKLEGSVAVETLAAIRKHAPRIQRISPERIRDEIMKILAYRKPSIAFMLMQESGLLYYIMPELDVCFDVGQNYFHADNVGMHTLHAVDAISPEYPFYRFCTLMHDLGKVPCKLYKPEKKDYVFYGHQYASKRMTRAIMRRLRFSNKEIHRACDIVENHMYNLKPDLSESAIRRFVRKLDEENVDGFLRMRMADRKGNRFNDEGYEKGIFHFVRSLRKIRKAENALKVHDLEITGHDLMKLDLKPGPIFSEILNQLLEWVLDDPNRNNHGWLVEKAREYAEEYKRTGSITKIQREEDETEEASPS
ncbi:MAG: CCA tRNA nucleotidyltransferase [bacterium]|jgi:tRNA nucleotidyltransferase (CCA-adding enzyme)